VGDKLSWFERLIDDSTSFDERQNITNLLLMEILKESSQKGDLTTHPTIPYIKGVVKEFDLTTARLDPGEPFDAVGYGITAITDGSLDGIIVRINNQGSDPITLAEVNPFPYPPGFTQLFLENTAQAGKYLKLYIGSPNAIASIELTSVTFAIDLVAQTLGNLSIDIAAQSIENIDININTAAIMMPVDIQCVYVMMPVDIQGQYVTLDINIKAQDVTINMDIEAQSVGIYLQPEWAALQGTDKNFESGWTNLAFGEYAYVTYSVPEGKTFYICGISGGLRPSAAGNAEKMLFGTLDVYDTGSGLFAPHIGILGGGSIVLSKPKVVAATKVVQFSLTSYAADTVVGNVTGWGYEL